MTARRRMFPTSRSSCPCGSGRYPTRVAARSWSARCFSRPPRCQAASAPGVSWPANPARAMAARTWTRSGRCAPQETLRGRRMPPWRRWPLRISVPTTARPSPRSWPSSARRMPVRFLMPGVWHGAADPARSDCWCRTMPDRDLGAVDRDHQVAGEAHAPETPASAAPARNVNRSRNGLGRPCASFG